MADAVRVDFIPFYPQRLQVSPHILVHFFPPVLHNEPRVGKGYDVFEEAMLAV